MTGLVRIRDVILMIMLWIVYLFWIRGLFIFLGGVFDWSFEGFDNIGAFVDVDIIRMFLSYAEMILVLAIIFIEWALYNQVRFSGRNRRKSAPPVVAEGLAALYDIDTHDIKAWQEARTLVMHHDEQGYLVKVMTI